MTINIPSEVAYMFYFRLQTKVRVRSRDRGAAEERNLITKFISRDRKIIRKKRKIKEQRREREIKKKSVFY